MLVRPDVGDEIEFLDEIPETPALPVRADGAPNVVDIEVDELVQAAPRLAEQRTYRRYLRALAINAGGEAA